MGGKGKKKKGAKDSSGGGATGTGPAGSGGGGGPSTPAKDKTEAEEGDEEDGEAKPKKGKGKKGKGKGSKSSKFQGDIFNEAAMENAYYICHNIQDVLKSRGFAWPEGQKKKKKGKKYIQLNNTYCSSERFLGHLTASPAAENPVVTARLPEQKVLRIEAAPRGAV
uniref:Small lysine-rich protein 1 n=2 Tax=Anopheles melas TaxID=34690 RepID=A0A182TE68_9DIPT